ncbi:MAG TPA: DUF4236 domain-containing protein [Candidatus Agathobaculum intestinipullorum]|nr:DUF4236 domain-containing protein [Candidatus Agathobaculum intestinipullorum]
MGFRFRKSVKIAPGVRLNFGKKSTGISIGNKYGGVSMNSKSGVKARASLPGTGISYSKKISGSKKKSSARATSQPSKPVSGRLWFLIVAISAIAGGIQYFSTSIPVGIFTAIIGLFMLLLWAKNHSSH